MHSWYGHGGWMWGMGLFWILVLALVIAAVVWLVRSSSGVGRPSSRDTSAEEILRQRYARGEIDEDEYRRRLDEMRR